MLSWHHRSRDLKPYTFTFEDSVAQDSRRNEAGLLPRVFPAAGLRAPSPGWLTGAGFSSRGPSRTFSPHGSFRPAGETLGSLVLLKDHLIRAAHSG